MQPPIEQDGKPFSAMVLQARIHDGGQYCEPATFNSLPRLLLPNCVGCCWVLMALLFEKTIPSRTNKWVGRIAGFLLIGWGAWMIAPAFR